MKASQKDHLRFWETLADDISNGIPLIKTLEHVRSTIAKTDLEGVTEHLIEDITAGKSLSQAMEPHESVFSRCVCAMVRAGEVGGVLDVVANRIVEGLRDGTLGPDAKDRKGEPERYWRTFGILLSSGVPVLHSLDLITEVVSGEQLREATQAVRKAIMDGKDMSTPMRDHPDVFAEEICRAVEVGEREGELDQQALRIADALKTGDLASLAEGVSETVEGAEKESKQMKKNVEYVNQLLTEAVKSRASDIHLDPAEGGAGRVRLRIDGVLHDTEPPEGKTFGEIVNRIKIMADLDLAERRLPQDGRIKLKVQGKPYDLRVCAVPTLFGERAVLRILAPEAVILDLDRLGLMGDDLAKVRKLCGLRRGIVICTGPTGCGKTTLLYAMLNQIDRDKGCVMTIEDPVEYSFAGMGQIQVDPRRGLTFARAIRSIFRQDPDVIMVGEIRDLDTAQLCAQVALTGHLVMTTLHAETAPGTIKRLLDMGMEPFLVNASLSATVSQRLVRMLCDKCKQPSKPAKHSMPPEAVEFVAGHKDAEFFGPKGCDECKGTGYRGRTAIHEIMVMDDRIRQLTADRASVSALRDAAVQGGMKTLLMDGLEKAARGVTSVEEVLRVVPH